MNSSIPFEVEGARGHLHRADGAVDGMSHARRRRQLQRAATSGCRGSPPGFGRDGVALRSARSSAKVIWTAEAGRLRERSRGTSGIGRGSARYRQWQDYARRTERPCNGRVGLTRFGKADPRRRRNEAAPSSGIGSGHAATKLRPRALWTNPLLRGLVDVPSELVSVNSPEPQKG